MTHLNHEKIRGYRERSLAPAELLEVSQHLGGCEACRARMTSPEDLSAAVEAMQGSIRSGGAGPHHLTYEEIEAYVDGTGSSGARDAVESHARECDLCAADVREIAALRRELESPAPTRAARNRWAEFWSSLLSWRGGLVLAATAAAVVVVFALRTQNGSDGKTAEVRPSGTPAQQVEAGSVIHDGSGVFTIRSGGRIDGLQMLAEADRATLEKALGEGRVEPATSLADLTGKSGVLLGAPGEPALGKLLAPLGTVVESDRPVFRWEPVSGATYRVSVYDPGYNLIASSGSLSQVQWQPAKPLGRGTRYSWQLTVRRNGNEMIMPAPPAPEARFRVLSEVEQSELVRSRMQASDSHLVLGVLYARAGLLDQAEQEMQALREQNPSSKEVADLLASIEQLRGGAH